MNIRHVSLFKDAFEGSFNEIAPATCWHLLVACKSNVNKSTVLLFDTIANQSPKIAYLLKE